MEEYELFNDVEDKELQTRNRAVILWNIFESHTKNGQINAKGVVEMIQYTKAIPKEDRQAVVDKLQTFLKDGGKH